MSEAVERYKQAVCTRMIAMLSPPTNEDLASRLAMGPPEVRVQRRVASISVRAVPVELCAALLVCGFVSALLVLQIADRAGRNAR